MFDRQARDLSRPVFEAVGGRLFSLGLRAMPLTGVGFAFGVGACVAVGLRWWYLALALWLANRVADGLDGVLARRVGATDFGGYVDLLADFTIYSGFVVAIAVAQPAARTASVVLLFAYYLSGTALLTASGLAQRRGVARPDERSVRLLGGLAEGLETMVVYVLILVFPGDARWFEWLFAGMVFITAGQRVLWTRRALSSAVAPTSSVSNSPVGS